MQGPYHIICSENSSEILLRVNRNQETIFSKTYPIQNLIQFFLLQNKRGKTILIDKIIKITVFWNASITIATEKNCREALWISCPNRITLQDTNALAVISNSRSLHINGSVFVKNLLFQHFKDEIQSKIILENTKKGIDGETTTELNLFTGRFKIDPDSKLTVSAIKILESDLIIAEKAVLKIDSSDESFVEVSKSKILIYPEGRISSESALFVLAEEIQNRGYIRSKAKNQVHVVTKKLVNFGWIGADILNVCCQKLINQKFGKFQGKIGAIKVQKSGINNGEITADCLLIDSNKFEKRNFQNNQKIKVNQFSFSGYLLQNNDEIFAMSFKASGNTEKNVFCNKGRLIPYENFVLQHLIFQNGKDGYIESSGKVNIEIDACLNSGGIVTNEKFSTKVKGILSNRGFMIFNKSLKIFADTFANYKDFTAYGAANIKVNDLFLNENGGNFNAENINLTAETIINNGKLGLYGQNKIRSAYLLSKGSISSDMLNVDTLHIEIGGEGIQARCLYVQVPHFVLDGKKLEVENFTLKGLTFQNNTTFIVKNNGQICLKHGFTDHPKAETKLHNVKFTSGPIMDTYGKLQLKNVTFEGVKYFANFNDLHIENVDYKFSSFVHNNLHLKNAHITTNTYQTQFQGKIHNEGGSNGLHQREKTHNIDPYSNEFVLSIQTPEFAQKVVVYMEDNCHFKNVVTSSLNSYYVLDKPLAYGDFYKSLFADKFDVPGNDYHRWNRVERHAKVINFERKQNNLGSPNINIHHGGQKELNLNINADVKLKANLNYNGAKLNFKSNNLEIVGSKVTVPQGMLKLESNEVLKLLESYVQAKGIHFKAKDIQSRQGKYIAGLQNILIEAQRFIDYPTITTNVEYGWYQEGKSLVCWQRMWQTAKRSEFRSGGSIIIRADQFLQMVSPDIKAQKDVQFSSQNILIHGVFLIDQICYEVYKGNFWGSKKNTYFYRDDKGFPTKIEGQNVIFEGKNAKVNANIAAKKLYDLTEQGVHFYFIIGYNVTMENRQFINFATQGAEGFEHKRQKLLKTDLSKVEEIYRPIQNNGYMLFDTVNWGKNKAIIHGNFKQKVYVAKEWYRAWHHETIAPGVVIVVGMAASFFGAQFIAPSFITETMAGWQVAMVKAGFATLTKQFAIAIVGSGGDFGKALSNFFSLKTVRALAFSIGSAGITKFLCDKFEINPVVPGAPPNITGIFSEQLIKHAVNISLDAVINGNFPKNLKDAIVPFVVDVFGEYAAGKIGQWYAKDKIDYFLHKGLHGVLGGLGGLIKSGSLKGALSGAVAAVAAEIAFEAMVPMDEIRKAGIRLAEQIMTKKQIDSMILIDGLEIELAMAKIIGTCVGGLVGGDWSIAQDMAVNAIDNNAAHIAWAVFSFIGRQLFSFGIAWALQYIYEKELKKGVYDLVNMDQAERAECDKLITALNQAEDFFKGNKQIGKNLKKMIMDKEKWAKNFNLKKDKKMLGQNNPQSTEWLDTLMNFKFTTKKIKYIVPILMNKAVKIGIDKYVGILDIVFNQVGNGDYEYKPHVPENKNNQISKDFPKNKTFGQPPNNNKNAFFNKDLAKVFKK